ncbi:hypothetical protein IU449_27065 [Nocardia higoensis]|uniref:Uncharacterized protein n=1 Tax=Nocardia higoensis TaxID=228599 RepID=A0ABS0DI70_9NOCA|nr:hypothetical protein [Nocardia higoensis]MBF6358162.1 hypothetical protein [Nocardia higoensis]
MACITPAHQEARKECERVPLLAHGMNPEIGAIHWAITLKGRLDSAAQHIDDATAAIVDAIGDDWQRGADTKPNLLDGIAALRKALDDERAAHEITAARLELTGRGVIAERENARRERETRTQQENASR